MSEHEHKPEGVSVRVRGDFKTSRAAADAAKAQAAKEYPSIKLSGKVIMVDWDAFGPNVHEVVLEVAE